MKKNKFLILGIVFFALAGVMLAGMADESMRNAEHYSIAYGKDENAAKEKDGTDGKAPQVQDIQRAQGGGRPAGSGGSVVHCFF